MISQASGYFNFVVYGRSDVHFQLADGLRLYLALVYFQTVAGLADFDNARRFSSPSILTGLTGPCDT